MLDWHDKQLLLFPARHSEDDPKCDVPPNTPGHKFANPPLPSIRLQLSNREDELLRPYTLSRQLVTRSCSIVDFVTSDDCGHQAWRDHLALWRYTYLGQANPVEQQEKLENSNGG